MVMPNDTGVASNGFMVHEQAAVKAMSRKATTAMLQDIGVVGMMPVFPRPEDQSFIYTHALDRDSLETKLAALHRLDLQLITMVDDASERLAKQDITVESEVVIWGFSASGMFANRFTALHPQRVLAAVVGSPGGWPVAPVESWNDRSLPYPVGVADMDELVDEPFDAEDFAATPQFFYLGQEDITDTVLSEESYNDTARSIIMELFGPSPVERWGIAEEIYASAGVNATFRLYPGAGHMTTPEMYADITAFVQDVLQAE
jgi:pimeloyl-ACP methyl ester carboxylesterase